MPIVSFSLPEPMIEAMDDVQKSRGVSGRSELVRASIRLIFEATKEKHTLSGPINAIRAVAHLVKVLGVGSDVYLGCDLVRPGKGMQYSRTLLRFPQLLCS